MSIISKRLVSIAASTLVLSLVSASANAQFIDVFNLNGNTNGYNMDAIATYQFTSNMTLNSIGFMTFGYVPIGLSYEIDGDGFGYRNVTNTGTYEAGGLQWFNLGSGLNVQSGQIVRVKTSNVTNWGTYSSINAQSNVSYLGLETTTMGNSGMANSNLRVSPSNPGSNVAPEPGSFALALTGGAALIGICVRRRRNAG